MLLEDAGVLAEPRRIDRPQPELPDRNIECLLRRRWREGKRDRSREQKRQQPAPIAHGPYSRFIWPRARTRPLCLLLFRARRDLDELGKLLFAQRRIDELELDRVPLD